MPARYIQRVRDTKRCLITGIKGMAELIPDSESPSGEKQCVRVLDHWLTEVDRF